jgi:hypothetical protein
VVRTGVTLNCDSVERRDDILDLRTEKLGCCTQGISILAKFALILIDTYVLLVPARELAALKEVPNSSRRLHLNDVSLVTRICGSLSFVYAPGPDEVARPHE